MNHPRIHFFLFIGLIWGLLEFAACGPNPEECDEATCNYNGTCMDGSCHCSMYYEGTFCDSSYAERYRGSFNANANCSAGGASSYVCTVAPDTTTYLPTRVRFYNVKNAGLSAYADLNFGISPNLFDIPLQPMGAGTITGSGSLSADKSTISMNFITVVGSWPDTCSVTLSRL